MERDAVIDALGMIEVTLNHIADTAKHSWSPEAGKWLCPDENPDGSQQIYDLAGTLASCFEECKLEDVSSFVEFSGSDGIDRRKRMLDELFRVGTRLHHIENGNPRDPFLWGRESRDKAACEIVHQLKRTASHMRMLADYIESKPDDREWSRPISLSEAGKLYGSNDNKPGRYIKRLIDDGELIGQKITRQKWRFDLATVDAAVRDQFRPSGATGTNSD